MQSYSQFLNQIERFSDRFYLNRSLKGLLIFVCIGLLTFVFLSIAEYKSFFSVQIRTLIFQIGLVLFSLIFLILVLVPFFQFLKVLPRMSPLRACQRIICAFPELGDRLQNVLELYRQFESSKDVACSEPDFFDSMALLEAAVNQLSSKFLSYRFEKAVKTKMCLRYAIFALTVFLFVLLSWIFIPSFYRSSQRIIRYDTHFEPEFPFRVSLLNESLSSKYDRDYTLQIYVDGDKLPSELNLLVENYCLPCLRMDANHFSYTFPRVQTPINFRVQAGQYISSEYRLSVDYSSIMKSMQAVLKYPSYTDLGSEVIDNQMDFTLPCGTNVTWNLEFEHTDSLMVWIVTDKHGDRKNLSIHTHDRKSYFFSHTFHSNSTYYISALSSSGLVDTLIFNVKVIPDLYPKISLEQTFDSFAPVMRYFDCTIEDDYGFSSMIFHLECVNSETSAQWEKSDTIFSITRPHSPYYPPSESSANISYYLDLSQLDLHPSDKLSYWFSVCDNDPFYPYKEARSSVFTFEKLSQSQARNHIDRNSGDIDKELGSSLTQTQQLMNEYEKILNTVLSRKNLTWADRQMFELALQKRNKITEQLQKTLQKMEENNQISQEYFPHDSIASVGNMQIQELFNKLFDPQMMQKIQELQKMLEENVSAEKLTQAFRDLQNQNLDLTKEIDRNLQLFRQMEFDRKFQQLIKDVENMQTQSHELSQSLKVNHKKFRDSLPSYFGKNQGLEQKRLQLIQQMNELKSFDEKLEKPSGFEIPDMLMDSLSNSIESNRFSLERMDPESSIQNADDILKHLESLRSNLDSQYQSIQQNRLAEDARFIRLLLKTIIQVSFKQEEIMLGLGSARINDPRYSQLIREQSSLSTQIEFIIDSVQSISKRQPQVALTTTEEIRNIKKNSTECLGYLLGMNNVMYKRYGSSNSWALSRQQYLMTSLNNLALLLAESLENIQHQMSSSSNSSSGSPMPFPQANPSSGKESQMPIPGMKMDFNTQGKSLQQLQSELNQQLENLMKMISKNLQQESSSANTSSETTDGAGNQLESGSLSEEFAKAAAKQEMIRRMVQEKISQISADNPRAAESYRSVLGNMENTEKDLVNKMIDPLVLMRQKNIESRLLEAENAELTRDKGDKRKSKTANGVYHNPVSVGEDSIHVTRKSSSFIQYDPIKMKPYYNKKYQEYLYKNLFD